MTEITNEELENLYLSDLSTIIQFRDQGLITENEFRYVLHLREDHLKKNGIVWHPYPQNKPKKDGRYLVTMYDSIGIIYCKNGFLGRPTDNPCLGTDFYKVDGVSAWAELPPPYKP